MTGIDFMVVLWPTPVLAVYWFRTACPCCGMELCCTLIDFVCFDLGCICGPRSLLITARPTVDYVVDRIVPDVKMNLPNKTFTTGYSV